MGEVSKKKRRSVNRTQSRVNLLCVVARMWADVHSGAKKLSDLSIKDYNQDNVLGNIGIEDLKKYIMQHECPTFAQMCELRESLSQKVRSQSRQAKALSEFTDADLQSEINRRNRRKEQLNLFTKHFQ